METYTSIMLSAFVLCIVILVRNQIVFSHRTKAAEIIFSQDNWRELQERYLIKCTYNRMVFDMTKWTFSQMFPGLK